MIRVLLVDDSELIRRGLRLLLSTTDGIEVVAEASDGNEALAVIASDRPDIVLSDVKMAGMSGLELARRVAEQYAGLPIILLTTFDEEALVQQAMAAQVSGFLLKDSTLDDLEGAIASALSGGLSLDPRIARAALARPEPELDPLAALTPGERAVAEKVVLGHTNGEIANELHLAEGTVKNHVSAMLRKLQQRDRTGLALHLSRHLRER